MNRASHRLSRRDVVTRTPIASPDVVKCSSMTYFRSDKSVVATHIFGLAGLHVEAIGGTWLPLSNLCHDSTHLLGKPKGYWRSSRVESSVPIHSRKCQHVVGRSYNVRLAVCQNAKRYRDVHTRIGLPFGNIARYEKIRGVITDAAQCPALRRVGASLDESKIRRGDIYELDYWNLSKDFGEAESLILRELSGFMEHDASRICSCSVKVLLQYP
jgi:hypothetical protein